MDSNERFEEELGSDKKISFLRKVAKYSKELIIVPSSVMKIWDTPQGICKFYPAYKAYIGNDFLRWRKNPVSVNKPWLILSPKFGYIEPELMISNYNVTFDDEDTRPITDRDLRIQVKLEKRFERELSSWKKVFVVWNNNSIFFNKVKNSFEGFDSEVDYYPDNYK